MKIGEVGGRENTGTIIHWEALVLTEKKRRTFSLEEFVCIKELGRISSLNRRTKPILSVFHSGICVPNERTRSAVADKGTFRFIKRSNLNPCCITQTHSSNI